MELGTFVLRRLIGPVVSRVTPAARTAWARFSRGRCFRVPRGKTCVVIPEALDYESATVITQMLDGFWYEKDRDWKVVRAKPGFALTDAMRRENLIILGGPEQNPVTRELLREHPDLLQSVRYHGGAPTEFRWQDHVFRTSESTDFALLTVKRNVLTSDPRRRLVLIFGIRDIGTLAASRLFADKQYAPDRRALQRSAGMIAGDLEVLLHVSHSAGDVHQIRPARRSDGAEPEALAPAAPERNDLLQPLRAALARIYESLEQHRRSMVFSDLRFTLTVTRDFSLQIEEEVTVSAERQDVVVFSKAIRGTPLAPGEDISFATNVVDGDDDQVSVPAEVLESERRFLVFPFPALVAGGRPRRIHMSAVWPRACRTLQDVGGEDVNSVTVSDAAGPRVDFVTVTIRFDVYDAAFHVIERFSRTNALDDESRPPARRRTYDIHSPYRLQMADVRPGTTLEFRIVRILQPDAAR